MKTHTLLISLLAVLAGESPLFAHKLLLDCRVKGERVRVDAYYDDNTPVQGAKIVVENGAREIATGQTDEHGVWSCPLLPPGKYKVRAQSVGHAATAELDISTRSSLPSEVEGPQTAEQSTTSPEKPAAELPPSREEKTKTPWLKAAIGLAVVAGLFALLRSARKGTPPGAT